MRTSLLLLLALASACSRWVPMDTYGAQRELARRPVGSPRLVETTEVSASGGLLSTHEHVGRAGVTNAYGSVQGGSVKQTFCAQTMQIDLEQTVDTHYQEFGHVIDYAGGAALVLGGIGLIAVNQNARSFHEQHFNDPFFAGTEPSATPTVLGALFAAGGAAWAGYSAAALPRGPQPQTTSTVRRWSEERLVEVQGCAMPGTAPASGSHAAQRLEELKRLRDAGILTEEEYLAKRKAALDAL